MTAGVVAADPASGATLLVADSGPLIVLGLAELLQAVAQTYGPLAVPEPVLRECLAQPGLPGEAAIRRALVEQRLQPVPAEALAPLDPLSGHGLGTGEVAVLAYARARQLTALIDDRKARRTAQRLAVAFIGSGAVLVGLKQAGRIDSVQAVLASWAAHGYFVGDVVRQALLAAAGE